MKKMQIESLVLGMVSTNCYFVKNTQTKEMLIIDPADEAGRIIDKVNAMEGRPKAVLLTHGHFDHMGAAQQLHVQYDIPVCALDKELEVTQSTAKNLTTWGGNGYTLTPDRLFHDGQVVTLAGFEITVIHTPGHTCGSTCYYFEDEQVLFSGDTLFCCSVGRTDFPTGSMSQIHKSIHEKLFVLPETTLVYPGHDQATDIAYEKKYNPY